MSLQTRVAASALVSLHKLDKI